MLALGKTDFILITDFLHQENGIKGIQQAQAIDRIYINIEMYEMENKETLEKVDEKQ